MSESEDYGLLAYRILRPVAKKYGKKVFADLQKDLFKAGMKMTVEEYFAIFLLSEIIVVPLFFIISTILLYTAIGDLVTSLLGSVIFSILIAISILALVYVYPANTLQDRSKKIDNALHFATLYMATLSTTGMPANLMFKILSGFEEFGEISKISRQISEDIEIFGYDIPESLARHADNVPNNGLSELLWGIRATMLSGGDLNKFLEEKSKTFTNLFKRRLEEYVQTMSLFMEMYITVVIVGTILLIVLSTIMGMMGGFMDQMQTVQVLFIGLGVPFVTTAFILMLKTISPTEV
ncbi:Type II secretion system (T2SS), protein F [Candidatus Tiddalikarchaeum anstoanum]|nr:Type II secretion system (T2SS), protein F [Candidatus Tiddalikarchaeum anstoanum]